MALLGQRWRIDANAIAFDAEQGLTTLDLQLVNTHQTGYRLYARPQGEMHIETLVSILAGVLRDLRDVHLRNADLIDPFATQVLVSQAFATHVPLRQAFKTVRSMDLQNITLQHGVVAITFHLNAMVGKHVPIVFHVLAQLGMGGVLKPRPQGGQHVSERELVRCRGVHVAHRNVGRLAGLDAQADTHQLSL